MQAWTYTRFKKKKYFLLFLTRSDIYVVQNLGKEKTKQTKRKKETKIKFTLWNYATVNNIFQRIVIINGTLNSLPILFIGYIQLSVRDEIKLCRLILLCILPWKRLIKDSKIWNVIRALSYFLAAFLANK